MISMFHDSDLDRPILDWLSDYATQGILTTDTSLIIRGWNRWFELNTGRSAHSVIGSSLFEVFPDLVHRKLDGIYQEALKGQVTVFAHRFHKYLLKLPASPESQLSQMQQSALVAPLLREGEIVGTITSIEDVSDRVVRENELLAAREAADKANQAKDRFLAVLSHDLRTPLTAILGWAQVFRQAAADEQLVRKGAEIIARNAAIQLELIEQILDLSRITAAKLELDPQPVSVLELTLAALETVEPIAAAKSIKIERILPAKDRMTKLDPKRFHQIIWNLVSNAVKFTPQDGWVRATLEYTEGGFRLSIADNGKGISAQSMPHLFDALWQAEGSRGQGGLGLGLMIVKNLVELHGGTVRAESPGSGQGASFTVDIPWCEPHADQGVGRISGVR
jgi:signal transduction histidine kinase